MDVKKEKSPIRFIEQVEQDMLANSDQWCHDDKTRQKRVLSNLKHLASREGPNHQNRNQIIQQMKKIITIYKSPYEGRIDSKSSRQIGHIDAREWIEITQLDDTQKSALAKIISSDTGDNKFEKLENILANIALKQQIMDSMTLPNKTALTKLFEPIKNKLKKINERHEKLPFTVQCLLDQNLCENSKGYKDSFTHEIDTLLEVIDRYIDAAGITDKTPPQGQYADSVVPIAEAVKTYFPDIPIKSHRNSKFHKIIRFYFEEYLNVPRADYEYIINQALSN